MRCPKCHYIGFESGDRCRNCGYDFSLAQPPDDPAELPLRGTGQPEGPLADFDLASGAGDSGRDAAPDRTRKPAPAVRGDLPLFHDDDADRPLVAPAPRPLLSVRRGTPEVVRLKPRPVRPRAGEPSLELDLTALEPTGRPVETGAWRQPGEPAPVVRRLLAGAIDALLAAGIDLTVIYFTLRICGLQPAEIVILPVVPLVGFFLLLNGGYLATFTAAGGQTIGKMLTGIRVVGEQDAGVPFAHAVLRTAAYTVSVLPLGLGLLPFLATRDRRALHDRLAETRVVRA